MATVIQIKRSQATATPPSLAEGELAWSGNGDVLYIGSNGAVVPISGKRVPGTLTANQAIIVNSSGLVDQLKAGNNTANVIANSSALTLANSTVSLALKLPTSVEASGDYYLKADGSWAMVQGGAAEPGVQTQTFSSTTAGQ